MTTLDRRDLLALPLALLGPAQALAHDRPAGLRVLDALDRIAANLRATEYSHRTRIDERAGRYAWDCSAMAAFVLGRAAPTALAAVRARRPVAAEFYRAIATAPAGRAARGWERIPRLADARPGDVFAWRRPRWFPSNNTGHVGFVRGEPEPSAHGLLVRITDSTRVAHGASDTRARGGSGFGEGTLLFAVDPATGEGVGYGWLGADTPPEWIIPTPIAIGRVTR